MNTLARAMVVSGVAMLVIADVRGFAVGPAWALVAAVAAVSDFTLAVLFGRGMLGTPPADSGTAPDVVDESDAEEYGTLADGTPIRADSNPLVRDD